MSELHMIEHPLVKKGIAFFHPEDLLDMIVYVDKYKALQKSYEEKCKQLEECKSILKDLLETKEDLQTWRDGVYSTIKEVIGDSIKTVGYL